MDTDVWPFVIVQLVMLPGRLIFVMHSSSLKKWSSFEENMNWTLDSQGVDKRSLHFQYDKEKKRHVVYLVPHAYSSQ
jgi:hypothetical protein